MHLVPGAVVGGKYALVKALASGSMGSIWSARHTALETQLAIKFIHPAHASSPERRARFELHAIASARISSAHVVQVHDYGIEDDTPYLVMELLEGEDLGTRLKREERLSIAATCSILIQVAKGLRRANEAGIIHRYLTPANIFLARDMDEEIVKILDPGIAKLTSGALSDATATGQPLGSALYRSLDEVRPSKRIDCRSDLWSLGVILFRSITGKYPFMDDDSSVHGVGVPGGLTPVPSPIDPSLPPALDGFFLRAFERSPGQRFQSARELADAFVEAALGEPPLPESWSLAGIRLGSKVGAAPRATSAALVEFNKALYATMRSSSVPPAGPDQAGRETAAPAAKPGASAPPGQRAGRFLFWRALTVSALLGVGVAWQILPGPSTVSGRWALGVSAAVTAGSSIVRSLAEARDRVTADVRRSSGIWDADAAPVRPIVQKSVDQPPSVVVEEGSYVPSRAPAAGHPRAP